MAQQAEFPLHTTVSPVAASPTANPKHFSIERKALLFEVMAGLIASTVAVAYCVGFAALIFDGPIESGASTGIWMLLVGTAVGSVVIARMSSIPPMGSGVEATTVSMLKVLGASIASAATAAGLSQASLFATLFAGISVATALSGIGLYLVGYARLGQSLRLVPSAVTSGFMGATGLLVLSAGLKVATGHSVFTIWAALPGDYPLLICLIAALAFFLALQVARSFIKSPLLLPLSFLLLSAFVLLMARLLPSDHIVSTWFRLADRKMPPWLPFAARNRDLIDWSLLLAAVPDMIAMAIVVIITLVVRTSSFEATINTRADFDAELRGHGLANIITTFLGGAACAAAPGTTRLMVDLGSKTPLSSYVVAAVALAIIVAGIDLTAYFPLPLLGGLLLVVGWTLFASAVIPTVRQRSWSQLALIGLIIAVALKLGFAAAIGVGFAASCFLFAFNYSRVGVVRRHLTRETVASHVARSAEVERHLRQEGRRIHIYWLSGYIFFGSSDALYEEIRTQILRQTSTPVRFVIIDFAGVTGLDTTAVHSIGKLARFCQDLGIRVVLSGVFERTREVLEGGGLFANHPQIGTFGTHYDALAWAEDQSLPAAMSGHPDGSFEAWVSAQAQLDGAGPELISYLTRKELAAGEVLYASGSAADTIDIVAQGLVAVVVTGHNGRQLEVRRMTQRTVVGEMGFFRNQTRSASVIAVGPVVVYTLTRASYEQMQRDNPVLANRFLVYLIRVLSDRLEFTNGAMTGVLEDAAGSRAPAR